MKTNMIWVIIAIAALIGVSLHAVNAQNRSTSPTAELDEAKKWSEIAPTRGGSQDSRLSGGSGGIALPDNRAALPSKCELDSHAFGCADFCSANPRGAGCPQPDPPAADPPPAPEPAPAPTPQPGPQAGCLPDNPPTGCPAGWSPMIGGCMNPNTGGRMVCQ